MAAEPSDATPTESQLRETLDGYAGEHQVDVVDYWDDGEWHAHVISDGHAAITAEGGNRREALDALSRLLGLS